MKCIRRRVMNCMAAAALVGAMSGANAAGSLWNYSVHMDVTINRPAKDVWPYFVGDKKDQWAGLKGEPIKYTTIAGEPGKVGEVYTHSFLYQGYHLYYEAIAISQDSEIVLKITYNKNEKDPRRLAGYDLISLSEAGGRTRIDFHQAFALPVQAAKGDLASLSKVHNQELTDAFQELKRTVENGGQ